MNGGSYSGRFVQFSETNWVDSTKILEVAIKGGEVVYVAEHGEQQVQVEPDYQVEFLAALGFRSDVIGGARKHLDALRS